MIYNVNPGSIQKSFYGKCFVYIPEDNSKKVLFSYNTPILTETASGFVKHWDAWSQTTGRHVKAFCGLSKKEYEIICENAKKASKDFDFDLLALKYLSLFDKLFSLCEAKNSIRSSNVEINWIQMHSKDKNSVSNTAKSTNKKITIRI